MLRRIGLAAIAVAAFAADDPWMKVKELKSGTEIRIYKRGTNTPIEAKVDEVRDDALAVVVKNSQESIPKDEILRLDYRPPQKSGRMTSETKKIEDPNAKPPAGMNHGPPVPGTSYSSGVSIGGKPAYETIYRRPPTAPAKQ
jgi:hypothetical protein